jgi:uncharacterized protein YigE (DUF2233 family)
VLGPSLRYVSEWHDQTSAVLEFEADLDGVYVQGVDILRWNDDCKLNSFTVMVRPMRGLQKLVELMDSPVGLYVEEGREFVRANTSAGPGNFHMRPNGVFYVTGEVAGVLETRSFIKQSPQVDFATQSGPLLVRDGEVNARFVQYGGSRKYRAGVGSRDPNLVVFAISESEVSFDEFARLFRDKLRCKNALFLDGGSATSFYSPVLGRNTNFLPLGPIIGVYGPD